MAKMKAESVMEDAVCFNPGGHFNFPHPWPGQTPPPDGGGRGGCLRGVSAVGNTGGGFLQAPALAFELHQMSVMHEAIQ